MSLRIPRDVLPNVGSPTLGKTSLARGLGSARIEGQWHRWPFLPNSDRRICARRCVNCSAVFAGDEERADPTSSSGGQLRAVRGDAPRAAWVERAAHRDDFDADDEPCSARRRAIAQGWLTCGRDEPSPPKTVFGCTAALHVPRSSSRSISRFTSARKRAEPCNARPTATTPSWAAPRSDTRPAAAEVSTPEAPEACPLLRVTEPVLIRSRDGRQGHSQIGDRDSSR
jgi:hypothetical protein